MLWAVVSSARCRARKLERPVPSMSTIVQPRHVYRRIICGLERAHIAGKCQPPAALCRKLFSHCHQLVRVFGIGGITATLQRIGERTHVLAGAEGSGVTRVVTQHAYIIPDVFRYGLVGTELGAFAARDAIDEFGGIGSHPLAIPAGTRLDAEQIVAAAVRIAGLGAAPAGFERGLRDDGARVHAEFTGRGLGMRRNLVDELALLLGADVSTDLAGGLGGAHAFRGRALAELTDQHVGEAEATPRGQLHGQLVVHHALVHVALVAAEHRVAEAGIAHALQHHLGEDALELPRHFAQRVRIVRTRAAAQRRELREVMRVRLRDLLTRLRRQRCVDLEIHQMTMSSARNAPDSLRASRIATRSPGAAPTWLTARTMSLRSTPASNTNMRAVGWSTETVLSGTTTVSPPRLNSLGWLTEARSVMVTDKDPCATAAGMTRTCAPMTTVPVRELMMTRAGASPGWISICSSVDR